MAAPKFQVGDLVYFVESAKVGQIESYKLNAAHQDGDGSWYYFVGAPLRPPPTTATFGDRNTGKRGIDMGFAESELTDACTALGLAESYHVAQLAKVRALLASHCEETS